MIPFIPENIEKLKLIVCEEKNIDPDMLLNKTRRRAVVESRQLVIYFLYTEFTSRTLKSIGDQVGKHYSTVIHSIRTINTLREVDRIFRTMFERILKRVLLLKQGRIRRRTILHPYPSRPKRGILKRTLNRRVRSV